MAAQKTTAETLDQVVQALRAQLGSQDGPLVVDGIDQLITIHHKSVEDILSWITPDLKR